MSSNDMLSEMGDLHLNVLTAKGYEPLMRALGNNMFELICALCRVAVHLISLSRT
jgi:hypothetical protein